MRKIIAASLLGLFLVSTAYAAPTQFRLSGGSRLIMTGHSRLHGFEGVTEAMSGELAADWVEGQIVEGAVIRIPVNSLRTGNDARDHALQRTVRAENNPDIVFRAATAKLIEESGKKRRYRLEGEITVGGRTKPLSMDVAALFEDGVLRVSGETVLTMSGFDLEPPKLARWLGLEDRVSVHWETLWRSEAQDGGR